MQSRIDEAARRAGRDPGSVKRLANVLALEGEPDGWADQLLRAGDLGFEALLVGVSDDDPVGFIRRLGEEIAPRIR